jgi:hypothetical protein
MQIVVCAKVIQLVQVFNLAKIKAGKCVGLGTKVRVALLRPNV